MSLPRLTRRRFLGLAVAGAGLAACVDEGASPATSTPGSPTSAVEETPRAAGGSPPTAPTTAPRGGVARIQSSRGFTFDTFDAALAGDISTLEVLGRTLSRLVQYDDPAFTTLAGDLAAAWEQPDPLTLILRLDGRARWQASSVQASRPVTSLDVAAFLDRATSNARSIVLPVAQRGHDWLTIEAVEATADGTVRVHLLRPDPFILNTLAGPFALIQAPETVQAMFAAGSGLDPAFAAGSGPFRLAGEPRGVLRLRAVAGGHREPLVDEIALTPPDDPVEAFRQGQSHEVTLSDRRDIAALEAGGDTVQFPRPAENQVITTLYSGAAPWNDARLREALAAALHPPELVRRLVGGAGAPAWARVFGPLQPVYVAADAAAAGSAATLEEDRARAKALWDAAGGPALGTVVVDFPNVFDPRFSASSAVIGLLREALGGQFRAAVEPYTTIARKLRDHEYGGATPSFWFGWGPQFLDPVPARHLYETYSSRGPNFASTGFASEAIDRVLDRLSSEPLAEEREALVADALAAVRREGGGAILPWFTQTLQVFRRPFLNRALPGPWWDQHLDARTSLDTADAGYRGQP